MLRSLTVKKNNHEASAALSDVSRLLSRMATSRKAMSRLDDIIVLTREVARLGRAVNGYGSDQLVGQDNDGYGDPHHYARISAPEKVNNLVR